MTHKEKYFYSLSEKLVPYDNRLDVVDELTEEIETKGRLAIRMAEKIINATAAPHIGDLYIC